MSIGLEIPKKSKQKIDSQAQSKQPPPFSTSEGFYIPKLEADDPKNPPCKKNGQPKGLFRNDGKTVRPIVGEKCSLYVMTPPCVCFGFSYKYPFNLPQKEQEPSKATGMQICYNCTPSDRVNCPNDEEQAMIDYYRNLYDRIWDIYGEFTKKYPKDAAKWDIAVPSAYVAATRQGDVDELKTVKTYALKPILSRQKFPKTEENPSPDEDPSKTLRSYFDLFTKDQGLNMTVQTNVFEGDSQIDPRDKYMNTLCTAQLILKFNGTFWGGHGSSSARGSIKHKVTEVQLTPIQSTAVLSRRMIRSKVPALAIKPQEEPEKILTKPKKEDEEKEDSSFENPIVETLNIEDALGEETPPIVVEVEPPKKKKIVKKQILKRPPPKEAKEKKET